MGVSSWLGSAAGTLVGSYQARVKALTSGQAMGLPMGALASRVGSAAPLTQVSDSLRYATSDDVYAAVNLLVTAATSIPLTVMVEDEPAPDHDLQLLLDRGNRVQRTSWTETAYSWMWLTGECFVYINHAGALPIEPWPMSGERWLVKAGSMTDEWPVRYEVLRDDGGKTPVAPGEVVQVRTFNPRDPLRGLSPLSSLRLGLDAERSANTANRNLFDHGAMVDALLSVPGMTEPTRARLRDDISTRHAGANNAHGWLVVAQAATVEKLTITPRDAEFLGLQKLTTQDVAKAYLIPPMFLGQLEDATYSNYAQAWRSLISLAVVPGVRRLCAAMTAGLTWQYDDEPVIVPDPEAVKQLLEDADAQKTLAEVGLAKAQTHAQLVATGWEPRQAAELVYGPEVADGLEMVAAKPEPPAESPAQKAVRTKADRDAYAQLAGAQAALMPGALRSVNAGLQTQADAVLAAVNDVEQAKADGEADAVAAAAAGAVTEEDLEPWLQRLWQDSVQGGVAAQAEVSNLRLVTGQVSKHTAEFIAATGAERVVEVNETTRQLLREAVASAYANGEGIAGARTRIAEAFGRSAEPEKRYMYDWRVENIAQTESSRAFNDGSMFAMADAGVEWHEWQSSHLPNSRHGGVDGQRRKIGDLFDVRGYAARYPSDAMLPAGEACSCKCCTVPVDGPGE